MATQGRFEIRPAGPGDVRAIQQLWDSCGIGRIEADEMDALLGAETTAVLAAVGGGQVVGTAVAAFDGWRAFIYHVAVAGDVRRQGLAHDLMAEAERYLLSAGARHVFVTVHEDNTEGLALVGATGYLPEGEIVLAKRLASRPA